MERQALCVLPTKLIASTRVEMGQERSKGPTVKDTHTHTKDKHKEP